MQNFSSIQNRRTTFIDLGGQMGGIGKSSLVALHYVRKLRGGSQPILIQASDGFLYVVKFTDNLQGENLPFNESMGCELLKRLGLPAPEWAVVEVTDDFLDRNQQCWIQTKTGSFRPRAGMCFGSRFLGLSDAPLLEILSGSSFCRIRNRMDFLKIWLLDILCEHADNRQALFLEDEEGWLAAYFIDHGHFFGGPAGTEYPSPLAANYLDPRIYAGATNAACAQIQKTLQSLSRKELIQTAEKLPDTWKTPLAMMRFHRFLDRASDKAFVDGLRHFILASADGEGTNFELLPEFPDTKYRGQMLRNPIPPSRCSTGWSGDGAGYFARAKGSFWT